MPLSPAALTTAPLTPATWDAYAALIEAHHGVWGGCWCMAFHPEGANGEHSPAERRAMKQAMVNAWHRPRRPCV